MNGFTALMSPCHRGREENSSTHSLLSDNIIVSPKCVVQFLLL